MLATPGPSDLPDFTNLGPSINPDDTSIMLPPPGIEGITEVDNPAEKNENSENAQTALDNSINIVTELSTHAGTLTNTRGTPTADGTSTVGTAGGALEALGLAAAAGVTVAVPAIKKAWRKLRGVLPW